MRLSRGLRDVEVVRGAAVRSGAVQLVILLIHAFIKIVANHVIFIENSLILFLIRKWLYNPLFVQYSFRILQLIEGKHRHIADHLLDDFLLRNAFFWFRWPAPCCEKLLKFALLCNLLLFQLVQRRLVFLLQLFLKFFGKAPDFLGADFAILLHLIYHFLELLYSLFLLVPFVHDAFWEPLLILSRIPPLFF